MSRLFIWLLAFASIHAPADVRFSIKNSHMPFWSSEVTDTAPPGGSCSTAVSAPGDPVMTRLNCDQYNRCEQVTFVDAQFGSFYVEAKTHAGCYEELAAINQSFQGFGVVSSKETIANDGKGIWFQMWPDGAQGQTRQSPVWLELEIYIESLLRAYDFDTAVEDKGKATVDHVVELRYAGSGEVMWRKRFQADNAYMDGNPSFPFYDPPEQAYKTVELRKFQIPMYAGGAFHLYMRSELGGHSRRVNLGEVGQSGRSSILWWVKFKAIDREE